MSALTQTNVVKQFIDGPRPKKAVVNKVMKMFDDLGGRCIGQSDKTLEIQFPDVYSAQKFQRYAESFGVMFDWAE